MFNVKKKRLHMYFQFNGMLDWSKKQVSIDVVIETEENVKRTYKQMFCSYAKK